jgi:hypothetical protein
MALIVNTLPAAAGMGFARDGWKLFKRQPLGLPAMTVVYLTLRYLPALLIPYLGLALAALLAPFAVVGMMSICREVAQGRVPLPGAFARPFKDEGARRGLFNLGLIHMGLSVITGLFIAFFMPDLDPDLPWSEMAQRIPVWLVLATFVIEVLILMLMWFAPLFVAWHREPAAKAMFFSFMAVRRNGSAFALLLAVLMLVSFAAAQVAGLISLLLPSAQLVGLVLAPLILLVVAFVQCAAYASYDAVVSKAST